MQYTYLDRLIYYGRAHAVLIMTVVAIPSFLKCRSYASFRYISCFPTARFESNRIGCANITAVCSFQFVENVRKRASRNKMNNTDVRKPRDPRPRVCRFNHICTRVRIRFITHVQIWNSYFTVQRLSGNIYTLYC